MIVVASTIPAYVMDQPDTYEAWLRTQDELRQTHEVRFFAALEYDGRGQDIFAPIIGRLDDCWFFRFDDGATEIRTSNRLRRITMGQNLCSDYAVNSGATHMLFMAADCTPPGDALVKLLEVDWPIVGGEVTTYCLSGPWITHHPGSKTPFDYPVQSHMATAAFVMLNRDLLKRLHWRYDVECEMSDDPCLHHDALQLGYETLVRKDCIGHHFPEAVPPIEERGHDRRLYKRQKSTDPAWAEARSALEAKTWLTSVALSNRGCQAVACMDQDAVTVDALYRLTSDPSTPFTAAGTDPKELTLIRQVLPVHTTLGAPLIHGPAAVAVIDLEVGDTVEWDAYAAAGARVLILHGHGVIYRQPEAYFCICRCTTPDGEVVMYDKLSKPMPVQPE